MDCKHEFIKVKVSGDLFCKKCEFEPSHDYLLLSGELQDSQAEVERFNKCIEWGVYECNKLFKYGDACNVDQAEGMRKLLDKLNEAPK